MALACEAPPSARRPHGTSVRIALRRDGIKLLCLGTMRGGSPRHPLYLSGTTELREFHGWRGTY